MSSVAMLAGCTASPQPAPYACLLPSEQRMLIAELFFGRNIKGREPLTDVEWAEFAAQTITPNFPDGFSVFDGEGQWRNPQPGMLLATAPNRAYCGQVGTRSHTAAVGGD